MHIIWGTFVCQLPSKVNDQVIQPPQLLLGQRHYAQLYAAVFTIHQDEYLKLISALKIKKKKSLWLKNGKALSNDFAILTFHCFYVIK